VISKATTTAKTKENAEAQRTQRNAEKDKGNSKSFERNGRKVEKQVSQRKAKTTPKWDCLEDYPQMPQFHTSF